MITFVTRTNSNKQCSTPKLRLSCYLEKKTFVQTMYTMYVVQTFSSTFCLSEYQFMSCKRRVHVVCVYKLFVHLGPDP